MSLKCVTAVCSSRVRVPLSSGTCSLSHRRWSDSSRGSAFPCTCMIVDSTTAAGMASPNVHPKMVGVAMTARCSSCSGAPRETLTQSAIPSRRSSDPPSSGSAIGALSLMHGKQKGRMIRRTEIGQRLYDVTLHHYGARRTCIVNRTQG